MILYHTHPFVSPSFVGRWINLTALIKVLFI